MGWSGDNLADNQFNMTLSIDISAKIHLMVRQISYCIMQLSTMYLPRSLGITTTLIIGLIVAKISTSPVDGALRRQSRCSASGIEPIGGPVMHIINGKNKVAGTTSIDDTYDRMLQAYGCY